MEDHRLTKPILVDLQTAMGDPFGADPGGVPHDAEIRQGLIIGTIRAPHYWYLRGLRRYISRDFDGAIDAMNRALVQDGEFAEAHFLKGVCNQLVAVITAQRSPDFPDKIPLEAHARLLKARWSLSIALDLNPQDEEARTYLQGIESLLR